MKMAQTDDCGAGSGLPRLSLNRKGKIFALGLAALAGFQVGSALAGIPPPPPSPPPPIAPAVAAPQGPNPAATRTPYVPTQPDTTRHRLEYLRGELQKSLEALKQAPIDPNIGFIEKTIEDLNQMLTAVDGGLAYVKAHPESDPLWAVPSRQGMPLVNVTSGSAYIMDRNVIVHYPTLPAAFDRLDRGLNAFLNGATNVTDSAVIGELGGFRDKIIRGVSWATVNLVAGAEAYVRASAVLRVPPPPGLLASPADAPKSGSISGSVVNGDGKAANVLVTFQFMGDASRALPVNAVRANGVPVTITDDQGNFTIRDIPPGDYSITAVRGFVGGYRQSGTFEPIKVSAGADAKLAKPIMLQEGIGL